MKYLEEGVNTQEFELGKLYNPFVCCDYEMSIFGQDEKLKYMITADNCTCNLYLGCSFDICNHSKFFVKDSEYKKLSEIEIVILWYFLLNLLTKYLLGNSLRMLQSFNW